MTQAVAGNRFTTFRILALTALAWASGCAPLNYTNPVQPSSVACCVSSPMAASDSLLVVSYNIRFAQDVPGALEVLENTPALAAPDIVLLQEMDGPGATRVARALDMNLVYYPAVRHPSSDRDFGNAVLSRWPVLRHKKVILPHNGRFGKTQRIGVLAVLDVAGREVTVASVHLATPIEVGPDNRRDQADAIADFAAATKADLVLIGGDLNDPGMAKHFEQHGYACPTRGLGSTSVNGFALDHVLVRRHTGSAVGDSLAAQTDTRSPSGVVPGDGVASDHFPVWTRVALGAPPRVASAR